MEVLSNNEISFIQDSLKIGIRTDGRGLFEFRRTGINFLQKRGHVEVALGDSLVFCASDAALESPFSDRPGEGFLTFNVNFLPMARPNFEQVIGANLNQRTRRFRNEVSQKLERLLEKTIKKSRALNPESLCIVSGKFAWHITVNLHILADHGNLIDLSVQAAVLSLMHLRVPDVKVNPDKSIEPLNIWKPLSLHFLPICVSFGFCKGVAFIDPHEK
jgi:exosome complex component RRP45